MRKTGITGALLVLVLIALPLAGEEEQEGGYKVGQTALDFTLKDLQDNDVALSDELGKVVVLTFWDWNCIECREESPPRLQKEVLDEYGPEQVAILAVSIDPNPDLEQLKGYATETQITYPILLHGIPVAYDYWVFTIPLLMVIDQQGTIQYRSQQALDDAALALIAELLPTNQEDPDQED